MDDINKTLQEIKNELKGINSSVREIDKTLVKQESQLAEHIRRTELLESKIEPIQKHVHMMAGAMKFIGAIAIIAGLVVSLVKISS